jgi:hypothetical protein
MRGWSGWALAAIVAAGCGQNARSVATTTTTNDGFGTNSGGGCEGTACPTGPTGPTGTTGSPGCEGEGCSTGALTECANGVAIYMVPEDPAQVTSFQLLVSGLSVSAGTIARNVGTDPFDLLASPGAVLLATIPFPSDPVAVSVPIGAAWADGGEVTGQLGVCNASLRFTVMPGQILPGHCGAFVYLDVARSIQPTAGGFPASLLPQFEVRAY